MLKTAEKYTLWIKNVVVIYIKGYLKKAECGHVLEKLKNDNRTWIFKLLKKMKIMNVLKVLT